MRIDRQDTVHFHPWDLPFVRKFGIREATDMVLDYASQSPLPFLYDTYQLAAFFAISRRKLFDYTKHTDREYRAFPIPKKDGSIRQLYVPSPALKSMQSIILHSILERLPVSPYATAYVRHGTLRKNAAPHVGKRYLLKLDIMDFFGSIPFEQVYTTAFNTRYFPRQIGVMLTSLCCRREVLPQGAPTSPALSNLVLRRFDDYIGCWCHSRNIAYTRYCDDMTFSADVPLGFVYHKVRTLLEDMGYSLNEQKTRFVSCAGRQSVTGLTVNEKVSVPRDYKRRLRQEVYYTLKFGAEGSLARAGRQDFAAEPRRYEQHLLGQVQYVLQIEPDNRWFRQAAKRLREKAAE